MSDEQLARMTLPELILLLQRVAEEIEMRAMEAAGNEEIFKQ